MLGQQEQPIFLDTSGKRWRAVRLFLALLLVAIIGTSWWMGQRILSASPTPSAVSATNDPLPSNVPSSQSLPPDKLADELSKTNLPVIGAGPLVRLAYIKGDTVQAVYGEPRPRNLSADETDAIGTHTYVLEKFGATDAGKRLVLTFDDGPDPTYTPELLNILSQKSVTVTFFVVGSQVAKYPDIVARMVREGHAVANHSFTHPNLEGVPDPIALQEINLTRRAIRATTGYDTTLFRPPYIGTSDQGLRDSLVGIMDANRLGMTAAIYDFDTDDWEHPGNSKAIAMPPFDGADHVLLLHDAGGKREATLEYVTRLIDEARRHGYGFTTMSGLYPHETPFFRKYQPTTEDKVFLGGAQAVTVWPLQVMFIMFSVTVVFVFFGTFIYLVLAIIQKRRSNRLHTKLVPSRYRPAVAVIVPAYNEAKVLRACVNSLLKSAYKPLKIYIIDDGSTDNTFEIAKKLAKQHPQVVAHTKPNGGKSSALNFAIMRTRATVVVGIDADTHFQSDTLSRLVRHFEDPSVGSVAGLVKVGNPTTLLARCQVLEYASSIGLERSAQALLGGIMVVPGACGAWRREAVAQAGWYSKATLAEDCDLTVAVHVAGYRVVQDNTAIAYTEVPTSFKNFAKQRFRWMFGNVQVYRKYQNIIFAGRYGWLDGFVLPMAILSTLTPLLFLPLLVAVTAVNLLEGQFSMILIFFSVSFCFQVLRAWIGLVLAGEKQRYVLLVPISRLIYGPLRIYLIYSSFIRAIRGVPVGWNKLARAGMKLKAAPVAIRTH